MDESVKSSTSILCLLIILIHAVSGANDSINGSEMIRDGETLVSSSGIFELGFFTPRSRNSSTNRYLGIWHRNLTVKTYVWVANRQNPITTKSGGLLKLTEAGILALLDDSRSLIWSSTASTSVRNPTARLLDSGNLVVKDADDDRPENFVWQSFDHPSDTYLPGMMSLGWNLVTGIETYMSSWRSENDPAPGEFTAHLDPTGYPQILVRKGGDIQFRLGPWNGIRFSGAPDTSHDPINRLMLRMDKHEVRYMEHIVDPSALIKSTLSPNGVVPRQTWNHHTQSWAVYTSKPADNCDRYGACGANGICSIGNSPSCLCLDKFVPKHWESWSGADWSDGCVRRSPLSCRGDVFLNYSGIKLPDSRNSSFDDQRKGLEECREECLRNCSCMAYAELDIREGEGGGCLFYYGDLVDIRTVGNGGQNLYIRMASTELDAVEAKRRKRVIIIASSISAAVTVVVCLSLVLIFTRKRKEHLIRMRKQAVVFSRISHGERAELPFFKLSTILKATHHFSVDNKIGEGGFGPVYRGMLEDGQEIAVKRLSKASMQGVDELKNEVILIAKLQHRNLVRLLGCCIEKEENMLIYEYMPNSSLDLILVDETKKMQLGWGKLFHIINGIAKGLLYLHQDSRLRIIHRDLKASNVLLDAHMNPKISDFGLARSFGGTETEAKTHRVVGTYGYMSPEYAIDGLFSIKSDVFSFGVLVLEAVSGKRNRGFFIKDENLNLLGHAWTLYKQGKSYKLVDASLGDSLNLSEALRSIHVGLLCVQRCAEDRPSMSSVVFMLGNDIALPQPKCPGFFAERDVHATSTAPNSDNQVTITWPRGR
ncbi:hypothetical protein C2S53_006358 [Perilla frutescens var. hirtella]|uniref:Receptor-like serine/threonine-protein kinase n=1 Tax=Perilla frutescens var. hirtella TaxID=608512 RepID=A0AAD4JN07_PERFH|nr:hypothetical protein C2S53_006358 [Perilla frutescens var. hirtella]